MDYTVGLVQDLMGIWLAAWAFRRRYELDRPLDRTAKWVRWSFVLAAFSATQIPGERAAPIRVGGLIVTLVFLCWPNLAFHVTRFGRRVGPDLQNSEPR